MTSDRDFAPLLTELIEKVGLLRRDLKQKGDADKYEARLARIDQKLAALVAKMAETDPELAKALRTAWDMPARSLAFRNADHAKQDESRTTESKSTKP